MRVGSLFAGIGGFDLAARWMGWTTTWYSEIDPYCNAVMAHHFPEATALGDITKIDWNTVEPVDLLCGGFPCQDISGAGKRVGIRGSRSGLWSSFADAIRECRPRWVVVENVAALLGRGYDVVRRDLRAAGYRVARPVIMSASAVGAPHRRERLWIVAYADQGGCRGYDRRHDGQGWRPLSAEGCADVVNANGDGRIEGGTEPAGRQRPAATTSWGGVPLRGADGVTRLCPTEPEVWPVAHGVSNRLVQLRALGNAIVPECALRIFQAIQRAEAVLTC